MVAVHNLRIEGRLKIIPPTRDLRRTNGSADPKNEPAGGRGISPVASDRFSGMF